MAKQGSLFKLTLVIAAIAILVLYTLFNSRLLRKGPEITDLNIYNGQVFNEENLIEITGKAENISFISLNGRQIFINEDKEFREKILLTNKINLVEIFAEDKFGKNTNERMYLTLDETKNIPKEDIDETINDLSEQEEIVEEIEPQ
jgi:hypothetical protein